MSHFAFMIFPFHIIILFVLIFCKITLLGGTTLVSAFVTTSKRHSNYEKESLSDSIISYCHLDNQLLQ